MEYLLRRFPGELLVRDVRPAERGFQLRAEALVAERFAGGDKRARALVEFARDIAKRSRRVRIAHRTHVAARREVHADAISAPHFDTHIGYFEQEAGAVFNRAAVRPTAIEPERLATRSIAMI